MTDEIRSAPIAPIHRWFPALKHRAFRLFLAGQSLSVIGSWMQQSAQGWYVQTLTADVGSERWLGRTAAVNSLMIFLFSTLGGTCADRQPRQRLILWTQTAAAGLALVFGMLVLCDQAPLWTVFVFTGLNGIVLAFDIPARQSFAVEMVGKADLMSGLALNSAVFNVGRLLGPAAAGFVIATLGIGACFALNAASFLGVIVALWIMQPTGLHDEQVEREGGHQGPWAGFRVVLSDAILFAKFALLAFVLSTGGAYLTLIPALAQNHLGLDAVGYSALQASNGLGGLVGALVVASLPSVSARVPAIVIGVAILGGGLVGLSTTMNLPQACACLVMCGTGLVLFFASTNSTIQLSVSNVVRGRVMAIWVMVFGMCQPIGSTLNGEIADRLGTPATLRLGGIACLLAAGVALILLLVRRPAIAGDANEPPTRETA